MEKTFQKELEELINKHSIENKCDMPDFLLAEMVCRFISVCGSSIKKNVAWHQPNTGCDIASTSGKEGYNKMLSDH